MKSSTFSVLVRRDMGYVLVELTLLHDYPRYESLLKGPCLDIATRLLSTRIHLFEKCKVTLRLSEVLAYLVEESENYRKAIYNEE